MFICMKNRKLAIALSVCAMLAVAGIVASCHKDKGTEMEIPEGEENVALPTEDQLDVMFSGKTVVLGNSRTGFNASVVNRLSNVSDEVSSSDKAVVFTSSCTFDFDKADTRALLEAYAAGANFVFINPEFPDFAANRMSFNAVVESILADNIDFDMTAAEKFYDKMCEMKDLFSNKPYGAMEAAAFRYNSSYVVPRLEDQADLSDVSASGYYDAEDNAETAVEKTCAAEGYEPTAYDYGKAADRLVEWMQGDDDPGFNSTETESIEKYMSGSRTVIQHQVGPSRALGRSLSYEMVYTVYSAYSFDENKDYYFIRLEPKFYCSELGCKNGEYEWVNANKVVVFDDGSTSGEFWSSKTDLWYGPYMSKFDYTARIMDGNGNEVSGVTLLQANPKTDVSGTSSVSTGMSFSLSGNLGFNSNGPTGGIASGFSFSESHSHSQNSLKVYHSEKNDTPNWRIEGIVPKCHLGKWLSYYHDEVATFQKSDWQTEFTWIVSVPDPQPGKPFYVSATDYTEITELNYNIHDLELRVHPTQSAKIQLKEPNRSRCNFIMSCSDNALQNVIAEQFSKTWQQEFTYYAKTASEVETGAKSMFETVKVAVKGYAATLVQKGYTDSYTFSLYKSGESTPLASFKLENGVVSE